MQRRKPTTGKGACNGLQGVTYDCKRRNYKARIHFEGFEVYIGRYNSSEQAALAYDQAARLINSTLKAAAETAPAAPTAAAHAYNEDEDDSAAAQGPGRRAKRLRLLNYPHKIRKDDPRLTQRIQRALSKITAEAAAAAGAEGDTPAAAGGSSSPADSCTSAQHAAAAAAAAQGTAAAVISASANAFGLHAQQQGQGAQAATAAAAAAAAAAALFAQGSSSPATEQRALSCPTASPQFRSDPTDSSSSPLREPAATAPAVPAVQSAAAAAAQTPSQLQQQQRQTAALAGSTAPPGVSQPPWQLDVLDDPEWEMLLAAVGDDEDPSAAAAAAGASPAAGAAAAAANTAGPGSEQLPGPPSSSATSSRPGQAAQPGLGPLSEQQLWGPALQQMVPCQGGSTAAAAAAAVAASAAPAAAAAAAAAAAGGLWVPAPALQASGDDSSSNVQQALWSSPWEGAAAAAALTAASAPAAPPAAAAAPAAAAPHSMMLAPPREAPFGGAVFQLATAALGAGFGGGCSAGPWPNSSRSSSGMCGAAAVEGATAWQAGGAVSSAAAAASGGSSRVGSPSAVANWAPADAFAAAAAAAAQGQTPGQLPPMAAPGAAPAAWGAAAAAAASAAAAPGPAAADAWSANAAGAPGGFRPDSGPASGGSAGGGSSLSLRRGLFASLQSPRQVVSVTHRVLHLFLDLQAHMEAAQQHQVLAYGCSSPLGALSEWLHAAWFVQVQGGREVQPAERPAVVAAAIAGGRATAAGASAPDLLALQLLDCVLELCMGVLSSHGVQDTVGPAAMAGQGPLAAAPAALAAAAAAAAVGPASGGWDAHHTVMQVLLLLQQALTAMQYQLLSGASSPGGFEGPGAHRQQQGLGGANWGQLLQTCAAAAAAAAAAEQGLQLPPTGASGVPPQHPLPAALQVLLQLAQRL